MTALLARLRDDQSGVSLVEFAVILPVMLLVYAGSFQLADAVSAYRKVTTTTRALVDLTTQSSTLTAADIDANFAAASQILAPYSSKMVRMRITQISTDAGGVSRVDWSKAFQGAPYQDGQIIAVASGIRQNATAILLAEIDYRYVPAALPAMIGTIPFRDQLYMNPRRSARIALQ